MTVVLAVLGWLLGALLAMVELLVRNPWSIPPAAVVVWVGLVHFKPYRPCRWCGGQRRHRGRRCWRCKGTKQVGRLGAKQVHRVKVVLIDQWHEWRDS